jgi:Heterokaryon incompatibility protein (HET)
MDLAERGEQIQQIGQIYSLAEKVVIFLGDEMEGTENAVQLLLDIGIKDMHLPELLTEIDPFDEAGAVSRLNALVRGAWFSRVWTIQKVVMARGAVLQRARYTVPRDALGRAVRRFWMHHECCGLYLQNNKPVIQMFASLNQAANRFQYFEHQFQQSTLRGLLVVFSGQRATNTRDHVFGLLGLLEPTERLLLPDYSSSCSQVLTKTALAILKKEGSVQIPHTCRAIKSETRIFQVGCRIPQDYHPTRATYPRSTGNSPPLEASVRLSRSFRKRKSFLKVYL